MPDMNITIPYPVLTGPETFSVAVYSSASIIVYAAAETNAMFTVPALPADDYILRVSFGGAQVDYCFTVEECIECPVVTSFGITYEVTPSTAIYYLALAFDYSATPGVFGCPFDIIVHDSLDGPADNRIIPISSFLDFTSSAGDTYYKNIWLPRSYTSFEIRNHLTNAVCFPFTSVAEGCIGPSFPTYPVSNAIVFVSSQWVLQVTAPDRGTDCHTVEVNYLQVGGGLSAPDSGTFTLPYPIGVYPQTFNVVLSPDLTFPNVNYVISYEDCCGNITTISYYATNY